MIITNTNEKTKTKILLMTKITKNLIIISIV